MPRLLSAVVVLLSLNMSVLTQSAHATSPSPRIIMTRIIVRLSGQPLAADMNLKVSDRATGYRFRIDPSLVPAKWYGRALNSYQSQEVRYIKSQGIDLHVLRTYHLLYNGFSALVPSYQLAHLRTLARVAAVVPDLLSRPMDNHSIALIHAPAAWSAVGGPANAGRGIYIADVDSGIDINNPCFKDTGFTPPPFGRRADTAQNFAMTNNKVVVVRAYGANPGQRFSARDQNGHGTFTAAIESCDANTPTPIGGSISGVAPAAYLMVYNDSADRTDGASSTSADIAAFQAAFQDGADVLNFSAGFPGGAGDEREDPLAQVINLESKAGLTVVVAAGNAGPAAQTVSSPSTADGAISVGASTNDQAIDESVAVSGPEPVPAGLTTLRAHEGSHAFNTPVGPAAFVPAGYGRRPGEDSGAPNADDFAGKDLRGKIALIQRGGEGSPLTFETKVNNAAAAGAIGVIIYDNRYEVTPPGIDTKSATLPTMIISQVDGKALLDWIKQHPDATVVMDPRKKLVDETPNVLSDFSSRGYGPLYRIKPDLVAPGQDIYSATEAGVPGGEQYDSSGFASADGTSFSAPHVAGAVALLLQKHLDLHPTASSPKWTPATVKAVLKETSSTGTITVPGATAPSVMEVGSGLLDVQAALAANADISPDAASIGQANVGYGPQQQTLPLTISDLGGGSGTWTASVQPLHGAGGLSVSIVGTVQLTAGGHVDLSLHLSEAAGTTTGDYDGYVFLKRGDESLHIPYFVHVADRAVAAGTVLLVDASTTRYQPDLPTPPIKHIDVSGFYEDALRALHRPFTYWDDATQGAPSPADMKRASAVVYFTGPNLNFYDPTNTNYEALDGPLSTIDLSSMETYLQGGGKLFISGKTAALSDTIWDALVLGAQVGGFSEYDNARNDSKTVGNVSPPQPSAVPDKRQFVKENPWLFGGMKSIDFSTKGNGAGDNLAAHSPAAQAAYDTAPALIGVTDLDPYYDAKPSDAPYNGYGMAVLRTANLSARDGNGDVGVVNGQEPSLKGKVTHFGRSVLFSFGFEGINDNTGYATRAQVLRRIFQWLDEKPRAFVVGRSYASKRIVQLRARLQADTGVHPVRYDWQINGAILKATSKPTRYRFPHAGTFNIRVQINDSLGHAAVSAWTRVTVH